MIFVFSNQKHGGPVIDNVPVPGYLDPVEPARLPFKVYYKNRSYLKTAPYSPARMRRLFGGDPPNITFSYWDIPIIPFSILVDLCNYFGITSPKCKSTEARRSAIKKFLKENG